MANTVTFTCRKCGKESAEPLTQAGKTTCCGHCGTENRVPTAAPPAGSGQIKIGCGLCGHRQYVPAALAGQPIACENCGKKIRVPAAKPAAAQTRSSAPAERTTAAPSRQKVKAAPVPSDPVQVPLDLFDDDSGSSEVVPLEVETEMQPLSPRGSLKPVRSLAGADAPESPLPAGTKKKKKKKKKSTYGLNADDVKTIGWAIIGLTVIVGGAAIVLPGVRSTIGLSMIVIGGLVMLLGNAGFAGVVREEGAIHYLMCRYVPLYSLYFLVTRWDRMRDHVMLATVGTVILAPGILLFSIAPDVKKDMGEDEDEDKPAATKPATKDAGQPPMPVKGGGEDEEG